ncbi:SDR family oxidoreductase [Pseudomonas japonica]|uniref:SDR family oxidoreductase n=1 Tax=Pseudomonas japonica TaxID=256466 RepID=UPI0015E4201F|nr:SDR family oxidoreductase [Pseudomonas japonica]MBA1244208.1 SDR family oxidoreductase [Pseudomonas japonica]
MAISTQAPLIVITGGSRGVGAATARLAAARGYDVAISYIHDQASAEAVAADVRAFGRNALAMRADSADPEQVGALFAAIDRDFARLDVLVNNAAILARQSPMEDLDFERMQRIFAVNAIGPILCSQQAVRRMATRYQGRGGAIVNISSGAARLGSPNEYVDYAASKGALETFTIGLAKEVARDGIRVNCIRPGHIYTDMHASGGEPGRVDRVKASIPMGRGGQPEEVARAILWLASEEASYTTGTFLDVTGGR